MSDDPLTIVHGDCVEVMRSMDEASVDAIVTDPPYELGFMGRGWDRTGIANDSKMWALALRVLRPGGHLLSFGGTRTFHRMTVAIEDAGFEIRDCLMWLYGSGFPKSLDVSKAIDKTAGAEREVVSSYARSGRSAGIMGTPTEIVRDITVPTTDLAKKWNGWGTALKPAWEPIILARKPLIGTVAQNVEQYGTGALNIDGTRIGTNGEVVHAPQSDPTKRTGTVGTDLGISRADVDDFRAAQRASIERTNTMGRWPANVLLDEEAAAMLGEQAPSVGAHPVGPLSREYNYDQSKQVPSDQPFDYGDFGGASRFFYTAKANKQDRGKGNTHPTVKPVDLMRYLCRLVTPPGGLVLDPFAGSGTTGQAALAEGFRCMLIEQEAEYVEGIRTWRAAMQLGLGLVR